MNDIRLTTPKGYAQYPYLKDPDTKFNPDGDYKVNLAMDDNEATGKLIAKLQQMLEDFYDNDEEIAKAVAKGRKVVMSDIYEKDEEGRIVLKFKQKAKITKKNGEKIDIKLPQFDSRGKPMEAANIGRDSVIKINFSIRPYYLPTTKTCGLSLRPVAVQVIKLNEFTGGGSAESYGFDDEGEGGYEAPPKEPWEDDSATDDESPSNF